GLLLELPSVGLGRRTEAAVRREAALPLPELQALGAGLRAGAYDLARVERVRRLPGDRRPRSRGVAVVAEVARGPKQGGGRAAGARPGLPGVRGAGKPGRLGSFGRGAVPVASGAGGGAEGRARATSSPRERASIVSRSSAYRPGHSVAT